MAEFLEKMVVFLLNSFEVLGVGGHTEQHTLEVSIFIITMQEERRLR